MIKYLLLKFEEENQTTTIVKEGRMNFFSIYNNLGEKITCPRTTNLGLDLVKQGNLLLP